MKIAVYYPWVYLTSGVERTILEMCRHSQHEYTIFTNRYEPENTYPEFRDLSVVRLPVIPVERQLLPVFRAAARIAIQKIDLSKYDGLLVHCDGLGNLILNRAAKVPAICLCHTPLRPVYDPHYRARAMARFGGMAKLAFQALSAGFTIVDCAMWRRYRYVIFNSQETLSRLRRAGVLKHLQGRYEVLHPGVDCRRFQPIWQYQPYFLVAGRIMWTKSIELAIAAFARFKAMRPEYERFRMVVAGRVDKKSKPYIAHLRQLAAGVAGVEFIVSPSDEQLVTLYANCYAAVFPAFNEDWGMVPLEANACGKPVIACDRGGPSESQTNGVTGLLVPCEPDSFAQAMSRLADDVGLVRRMGIAARRSVFRYDWRHFVERMDAIIEAVVRGEELISFPSSRDATRPVAVASCAD
jgi:glycosyltransferase involved in cell wall biosynthesis